MLVEKFVIENNELIMQRFSFDIINEDFYYIEKFVIENNKLIIQRFSFNIIK